MDIHRTPVSLIVAVSVSLAASVEAHAQPLFAYAESIESTLANADLVLIGKLVEFGVGERADGRKGQQATIAVQETLKKSIFRVEPYRRLRVDVDYPASVLANWKDRSHRLLVATNEGTPSATTMIELAPDTLEVLTADFKLLRDPEAVIRTAKETVRRMPAPVRRIHTFRLIVPLDAVAGTKWEEYYKTGGYLELGVPVDKRLEKRARDYIRSKNFLKRKEGVMALRYFKSDENSARVRPLLDDPGWAYLYHAQNNKGIEVRIYGVRQEAYRTLKSWGIRVEKPVTREEVRKLESVKTVSLSNSQVTDADLKELARFKNLQHVFLWNADVAEGQLKELAGLSNLRDLYLGGTKVTDAGIKHLAGLTNLRYLDLKGTRVTDEGLKVLAGFKSLKKLDLGDTKVTDEGVAGLRKLRPDLTIEH